MLKHVHVQCVRIFLSIRSLADMNNDGKMDKKEFSIAMHLIKKKLQGYELPKSLPQSLKADPSPMMGSFGTMPAQPAGMMPGMAPGMGKICLLDLKDILALQSQFHAHWSTSFLVLLSLK